MSFLTQLDRASHPAVTKLIIHHILGKGKYTLQLHAEMLATLYAEILASKSFTLVGFLVNQPASFYLLGFLPIRTYMKI